MGWKKVLVSGQQGHNVWVSVERWGKGQIARWGNGEEGMGKNGCRLYQVGGSDRRLSRY